MQKTKIYFVILGICLIFCVKPGSTQDIHFSQFSKSPLYVNPAYTGMFDGNWRFTNNYRNQWSSIGPAFKTISAGFDKPFTVKNGKIGIGVFFVNDQSGAAALTANKVFVSVAYLSNIRSHTISYGIQAGYVIQTYDMNSLTFPAQYNNNTGYFDSDLPYQIETWDENVNYPDINAGIAWTKKFGKITPGAGFSAYHINNPSLSYLNNDGAKLPLRLAANAYADITIKEHWFVRPDFFTSFTTQTSDYLMGGIAGYRFHREKLLEKIYAGAEFRTQFHTTDAAVMMVGIGFMGFDIGISYDINISRLRQATNFKGAFEISLAYTNFVKELERIAIPCDRY
ncbi:MAG: PorP/SprF family type IX secretion system membrane protein [Bacteroidales bacterium]